MAILLLQHTEVCSGETGHIETVEIEYDSSITSFENLLKLYYETHDFEQIGGQGPDIGEQYQSVVFYINEEQKIMTEKYIDILTRKGYSGNTVTSDISVLGSRRLSSTILSSKEWCSLLPYI